MATKPIIINITGSDTGLQKALASASKGVGNFAKKVGALGVKAGAAFGALSGAVAVGGVKAFGEFESQINEVMTLVNGAGKETFDELSNGIKNFSKEFGVLPDKAIPALYQALSAGVPKENVFEFMEVAQKAAKGGVTDLETAVDGISSVLNVYGQDVISATQASDLMFTAVKLGKTTMDEISKSMFQMAPIAGSVGVEFENLTASVAVLTSKGVPTSVAATQMKGALAELAKAGSRADVAFRDLTGKGFQQFLAEGGTFEEAILKMKDGADAAGISVLDMYGSVEAGQAILALTSDGGEAFADVLAQMKDSAGATESAFETMNKGFAADMEKIKANLKVLSIEIGSKLAPLVAKGTAAILKGFNKLKPVLKDLKDRAIELGKDIREKAVPILERIAEIFGMVADAAMRVWSTVYEYLAPGIRELAEDITDLAERAFGKLQEIFEAIPWTRVWEQIVEWAERARAAVMEFVRSIPDRFRESLAWIEKNKDMLIVFGGAIAGVTAAWALYQVKLKAVAYWTKAVAIAQKILDAVMKVSVIGVITVALFALVGALIAAYYRFERVREIVDNVIQFFTNDFLPKVIEVKDTTIRIFTSIKDYLETVFWPAIKVVVDMIVDYFKFWWEQIKIFIDLVIALFKGEWKEALDLFLEMVGNTIQFVVDFFIKLPGRLLKALPPIIFALMDIAKAFTVYLLEKIGRIIQRIVDFFIGLPKRLLDAGIDIAAALFDMGVDFGKKIIEAIVEGLRRAGGAISSYIMSLVPDVGSIVDSIVGSAKSTAKAALGGVGGAVMSLSPFSRGGIVTGPTAALIGEAGPEAVIPLDRAGSFGGITVNITTGVGDPVAIGDEVVEVLTAWQRANGTIPIDTSAA